jgi:hypothetical protein
VPTPRQPTPHYSIHIAKAQLSALVARFGADKEPGILLLVEKAKKALDELKTSPGKGVKKK